MTQPPRRPKTAQGRTIMSLLLAFSMRPAATYGQDVDQNLWGVNPGVTLTAAAVSGNTLYVGGNFVSAARVVGGGVITDPFTGAVRPYSPSVAGAVYACVADGRGGWFIGGSFKGVGGKSRSNLAHIFANGRVDAWAPDPDGDVYALELSGATLYVGGFFRSIGNQPRDFVATLDAQTGDLLDWNPRVENGPVLSILVLGATVYLGGSFGSVGGELRSNVASVGAIDGHLLPWNPGTDVVGDVYAIVAHHDTLFLGGNFLGMNNVPRVGLAAFDVRSGALLDWDAQLAHVPRQRFHTGTSAFSLLATDDHLYVGGSFNRVGTSIRPALVELDYGTATATAWDPHVGLTSPDNVPITLGLALDGTTLYVSGIFDSLGSEPARTGGTIDTRTGKRGGWNPEPNSIMGAIAYGGGNLYVGGIFTSFGPTVPRHGLAAFDLSTGRVTPWDPNPNGQPLFIASHRGSVFVGGDFGVIGGQTRQGVAQLDSVTGVATDWDAHCGGSVRAMAFNDTTAYIGGSYDLIGGENRHYLAEVDLQTGLATAWDPRPNSIVTSLQLGHDVVYAGGWFTLVGAGGHGFLVALDPRTGLPTTWDPRADALVNCIALDDTALYVGGHIAHLGGVPRAGFGAVSTATGLALPLVSDLNGEARQLVIRDGVIYVGGAYTSINGLSRNCLAAVDQRDGRVLDWDPDPDESIWAMAGDEHRVYPVGAFSRMGTSAASMLASLSLASASTSPPPPLLTSVLQSLEVTNPCHENGIVHFALRARTEVDLEVFDMQGRRVATLLDHAPRAAGNHEVPFATSEWRPGCYFYRFNSDRDSATRKFVVLP